MAIETVEDLREHIALATRVELSTIPRYLFAMHSIRDQESEAARLIASVVVEEMLHVYHDEPPPGDRRGARLRLRRHPRIPVRAGASHPRPSARARTVHSGSGQGNVHGDRESEGAGATAAGRYLRDARTVHAALEQAIDDLDSEQNLFTDCQARHQLSDPSFYAPVKFDAAESGGLMLINDGETADAALEIIIDQGEGLSDERWADPSHQELTHFHKFEQIAGETVRIGPVWPVRANPKSAEFPDPVAKLSQFFNALYGLTFVTMGDLFSGEHDQRVVIGRLYTLMSGCMTPIARHLVQQPISNDEHAGPTFEIYRFATDPWQETAGLAKSIVEDYADLEGVCSAVQTLCSRQRPV